MAKLEFDGACNNGGGIPTWGFTLTDNGQLILEDGGAVPENRKPTSNTAEFWALLEGLEAALELDLQRLEIRGDSRLVVNCVNWYWDTHAEHLIPLRDRAEYLIERLRKRGVEVTLEWQPRERNQRADELSKGADPAGRCVICGEKAPRIIKNTPFCEGCYGKVKA